MTTAPKVRDQTNSAARQLRWIGWSGLVLGGIGTLAAGVVALDSFYVALVGGGVSSGGARAR